MITAERWYNVLLKLGCDAPTARKWAPMFATEVAPDKFSRGAAEIPDFTAQVVHESAHLTRLKENLNYSARRLTQVWPRRFPDLEAAAPYAYRPEALARRVYGGRLGNVSYQDAEMYIGRGLIMATGRDNYALLEKLTGAPLLKQPSLLESPQLALLASVMWWEHRVSDRAIGDVAAVSKAVNGGTVGLDERRRLTLGAKAALAGVL